jgi:CDP-paratose 2-epimerase
MLRYSCILVAGGAGFVGSNLALRLREAYPQARIVVADSLKRRGSEWNLPRLLGANVEFVHADIRQPDDLAFEKTTFDLVVDCSAEPAVLAAYDNGPKYVIDTNFTGTVNVLDVARRDGAAVVFVSTSRVYPVATLEAVAWKEEATRFSIAGDQQFAGVSAAGISEDFPLAGARSLYGATKLAGELILEEYADMYDLKYVINRCGVVTGPWQMGKADQGIFAFWMGRHYFKAPLKYIGYGGTGKQLRDFIDIDELCDLILLQVGAIADLPHRVYNVGGGLFSSLSLAETTALCVEITGNCVEVGSIAENRASDIRLYVTDNARITRDTGWAPKKTPKETLTEVFLWIRANERLVRPLWS